MPAGTRPDVAATYLEAEGYQVALASRDQINGTRTGLGDDVERITVWVPDLEPEDWDPSIERPLLRRFEESRTENPSGRRFLLLSSAEGMSREFRSLAVRLWDVKTQVPVQFFDTGFRWDDNPSVSSAAKQLRDEGAALAIRRARQPYVVERPISANGSDLLKIVRESLHGDAPRAQSIQFVVGPAGQGKSAFFSYLRVSIGLLVNMVDRRGPVSVSRGERSRAALGRTPDVQI